MRDMQRYLDRAYSCLLGIKIINDEINKYNSPEKREEIAEKYVEDLAILEKEYKINMKLYEEVYSYGRKDNWKEQHGRC